MKQKAQSSAYINQQRRDYSLYVMRMRALPDARDGLKAGGRRVLWTARDGHKWKSANLAGATMPIHPHASPEGAIDTLAAQYGNNIPFFTGSSAFGTLLLPKEYSASRYTAVTASKFTQDVIYRDIEIVPMTENYDGTLMEPIHFLPLVPTVLINPIEGTAVGFATNILPRSLDDLILAQLTHLKGGKSISNPMPKFRPIDAEAYDSGEAGSGIAYYFKGQLEIKDTTNATITRIPYGQTHANVIAKLDALMDSGSLLDYTDGSKDFIRIDLKFRRGFLKDIEEVQLFKLLGITVRDIENFNVLDFTGQSVWNTNPVDFIRKFTDWRLGWYVQRYERLRDLLQLDLQKMYDLRCAIKNKAGSVAGKTESRAELREWLAAIGVVNTDYIADMPIYRFTEEGRLKNEERIKDGEAQLHVYLDLLSSEDKRKKVYISELQEVLGKYSKGQYDE